MKEDEENMKSHDFSLIFLLIFWGWFELRKHGIGIQFCLFFSLLFTIYHLKLKKKLSFYFLLYISFSLSISSIVLTQLSFGHQVFFCFVHFELIRSISNKSPVSLLCSFAEIYAFYLIDRINHYILLVIMLNFLGILGLYTVFNYKVYPQFNGVSTILTAILSIFSAQTIDIPLFMIFILFSLPRFPAPFTLNEITHDNIKFLIVAFTSFVVNIITFLYGVKCQSVGQQSVSLMLISNNIALFFSVLADILSRSPPNRKFSFGLERVTIVFSFSMSILLLFTSYNCISISVMFFVNFKLVSKTSKELLILTVISCFLDILSTMSLKSLNFRNCEILKKSELIPIIIDFTLSFASVVSAVISYFFEINFFDPFVSIATAIMFFIMSLPKFNNCFNILLEAVPKNIHIQEILKDIQFSTKPDAKLLTIGEETGHVMTLNCRIDGIDEKERLLRELNNRTKNIINDLTVEVV